MLFVELYYCHVCECAEVIDAVKPPDNCKDHAVYIDAVVIST